MRNGQDNGPQDTHQVKAEQTKAALQEKSRNSRLSAHTPQGKDLTQGLPQELRPHKAHTFLDRSQKLKAFS